MNFSHIISGFAGIGVYIVLQATVYYIERKTEVQVAQACVKQQVKGEWTEASCAKAKK